LRTFPPIEALVFASTPLILGIVLHAQLIVPARGVLPKPDAAVARATVHQNRVPAGRLTGRTLRIGIDIVESAWRPEGVDDPEVPILAFAEPGRTPTVPGPLIRVPQGTEVVVMLRNRSDSALVIGGLRPGTPDDTVHLARGASREVRLRLSSAGTYHYWGAFAGTGMLDRFWKDSQLNGAIVVDAPGASRGDHILVMSEWFLQVEPGMSFEAAQVVNGKGWPHTAPIAIAQGDSVRFRVINAIAFHHPLHLHGFFYRIESRGDGASDRPVTVAEQLLSNTDIVEAGGTVTFSFLASTPGNWLFHCHFAFHADESVSLKGLSNAEAHESPHGAAARAGQASHAMAGLVVPLIVSPAPGYAEPAVADRRELQLYVGRKPGRLPAGQAAIGFSLRDGAVPAADSVVLPGPVLELRRDQPVRIVINNQLDEPTSVHWHGLEIESYPDGVPHFSGMGERIYTEIAPRDSFAAEFTPTRSGTYPYHSHLNDRRQIQAGLYGALIVTDEPRDLTRDHLVVAGGGGHEVLSRFESPYALVNGRTSPRPLRLTVGETHRLRLISIHPDWVVSFSLRNDSTVAHWQALAKDGADLPPALATMRRANVEMGPGETADFAFTPTEVGTWRLEVKSREAGWHIPLTVEVIAREEQR